MGQRNSKRICLCHYGEDDDDEAPDNNPQKSPENDLVKQKATRKRKKIRKAKKNPVAVFSISAVSIGGSSNQNQVSFFTSVKSPENEKKLPPLVANYLLHQHIVHPSAQINDFHHVPNSIKEHRKIDIIEQAQLIHKPVNVLEPCTTSNHMFQLQDANEITPIVSEFSTKSSQTVRTHIDDDERQTTVVTNMPIDISGAHKAIIDLNGNVIYWSTGIAEEDYICAIDNMLYQGHKSRRGYILKKTVDCVIGTWNESGNIFVCSSSWVSEVLRAVEDRRSITRLNAAPFDKAFHYLLIPIYEMKCFHWSLVIMNKVTRTINVMDSFFGIEKTKKAIQPLLLACEETLGPVAEWEFAFVPSQRQEDFVSCGLYMLRNMEVKCEEIKGKLVLDRDWCPKELRARYLDVLIGEVPSQQERASKIWKEQACNERTPCN